MREQTLHRRRLELVGEHELEQERVPQLRRLWRLTQPGVERAGRSSDSAYTFSVALAVPASRRGRTDLRARAVQLSVDLTLGDAPERAYRNFEALTQSSQSRLQADKAEDGRSQ